MKPKILDIPREREVKIAPGIYITVITCSMHSVKIKRRIAQEEIDREVKSRLELVASDRRSDPTT